MGHATIQVLTDNDNGAVAVGLLIIVNIKSLILVRSVDEIVDTGTLIKHMRLDYLDKLITSIVYYFLLTMKE